MFPFSSLDAQVLLLADVLIDDNRVDAERL